MSGTPTPRTERTDPSAITDDQLDASAQDAFGFDALHPEQRDALRSLLDGRDTLAVMPTGAGKSAIYQLAGLRLPGPTVVVSPLLALQRDQVESIRADELHGGAAELNSQLTDSQRAELLDRLGRGEIEFCFLAPEQLARQDTVDALVDARPSLLVVDEAHCISTWGHDFRSDYLRLDAARRALGDPLTIALTATAPPPVQDEILHRLGIPGATRIIGDFERPNIHVSVRTVVDDDAADALVIETVQDLQGTGLVYVATRARAEELAAVLDGDDRPAVAYHAGMAASDRDAVHERFASGDPVVVCATIAFGLGIDVPHVRFVVHDSVPDSLDAYYQELGRAGRDGEPAVAVLVHQAAHDDLRTRFSGTTAVDGDLMARIAHAVAGDAQLELATLVDGEGISETRAVVAATRLADAGAIDLDVDGTLRATPDGPLVSPEPDIPSVVESAVEAHAEVHNAMASRGDAMRRYVESRRCRWQSLTEHFGRPLDRGCGHCDVCDDGGSAVAPGPFELGSHVAHDTFGTGVVLSSTTDTTVVRFDDGTERQLDSGMADDGLLTPVDAADDGRA